MGTKVDTDLISDDIIFHSFISSSLDLSPLFSLELLCTHALSIYLMMCEHQVCGVHEGGWMSCLLRCLHC